MSLEVKRLMREEILFDDLSAHEEFQWKCSEHVQTESKTGDVNQSIILRKIIQDVPLRLVGKHNIGRYGKGHARNQGKKCRHMCYSGKAIEGRCPQTSID